MSNEFQVCIAFTFSLVIALFVMFVVGGVARFVGSVITLVLLVAALVGVVISMVITVVKAMLGSVNSVDPEQSRTTS